MRGFGIPHRSLRSLLALLSRRQLLTRCSGAGFTSLRRELGWLPPHQQAASMPPDPQALSEREMRPHYQQSCPPCLTDSPGGPPMTDAIALRPRAAG